MSPVPAPDPVDPDGGGGGSRVLSFDFAHDTPGLNAGVTVWTPAVGDVLLDAWISVSTAFNGTSPQADIGTFNGSTSGLVNFGSPSGVGIFLDTVGDEAAGAGVRIGEGIMQSMSSLYVGQASVAPGNGYAWQATFTATHPLKLVVSRDGRAGGTVIGGTTGAATLYLMVATPTAL